MQITSNRMFPLTIRPDMSGKTERVDFKVENIKSKVKTNSENVEAC